MELIEYPDKIASLQAKSLEFSQQVRSLKRELATKEATIKAQVAGNADLRNDRQRDAAIALMKTSADYSSIQFEIEEAEASKAQIDIEIERLRSHFSVERLLLRERTALLEIQTAG